MPIHVKVVSAQEYTAWVADQNKKLAAKQDDPNKVWAMADLMQKAKRSMRPTAKHVTKPMAKAWDPSKHSMAQQ